MAMANVRVAAVPVNRCRAAPSETDRERSIGKALSRPSSAECPRDRDTIVLFSHVLEWINV